MSAPDSRAASPTEGVSPTPLPCPFCGASEPSIEDVNEGAAHTSLYVVRCTMCGVEIDAAPSYPEAVHHWNRRAAPSSEGARDGYPPAASAEEHAAFLADIDATPVGPVDHTRVGCWVHDETTPGCDLCGSPTLDDMGREIVRLRAERDAFAAESEQRALSGARDEKREFGEFHRRFVMAYNARRDAMAWSLKTAAQLESEADAALRELYAPISALRSSLSAARAELGKVQGELIGMSDLYDEEVVALRADIKREKSAAATAREVGKRLEAYTDHNPICRERATRNHCICGLVEARQWLGLTIRGAALPSDRELGR